MTNDKGYTYFVRDGDAIKIGSSMRPKHRLDTLQTGTARELTILAVVSQDVADEFGTHRQFADLRIRGEWFRADPRLLKFIEGLPDNRRALQPANFENYQIRSALTAQRRAAKGDSEEARTERMRISVALEKLRHQEMRQHDRA